MGCAFLKHEIGRSDETASRPEIIQFQGLHHAEEGEAGLPECQP
jgi:hypothetical protein